MSSGRPTRWCPNGDGEFEAWVTECLDCGAALVDQEPSPPPPVDHEVVDLAVALGPDERRTVSMLLDSEAIGHEWRGPALVRVPRASAARVGEIVTFAGGTSEELPAHADAPEVVLPGTVVLADRWRRFWSYLVDSAVVGVTGLGGAFALRWFGFVVAGLNEVVVLTITGGTIGKHCLRLRVITCVGGGPVALERAVVRWVVKSVGVSLLLLAVGGRALLLVVAVWPIIDLVPILTRPDRRALHDLVAGTLVIGT